MTYLYFELVFVLSLMYCDDRGLFGVVSGCSGVLQCAWGCLGMFRGSWGCLGMFEVVEVLRGFLTGSIIFRGSDDVAAGCMRYALVSMGQTRVCRIPSVFRRPLRICWWLTVVADIFSCSPSPSRFRRCCSDPYAVHMCFPGESRGCGGVFLFCILFDGLFGTARVRLSFFRLGVG